jgi:adenosylhomocysteine nucleosidase
VRPLTRAAAWPTRSLLTILSVLLLVQGCSVAPQRDEHGSAAPSGLLAVMSAYSPELTGLLAEIKLRDTCTIEGSTCYVGTLGGNEIILMLSGIGLESAAAATRTLLDSFTVRGIVFSGIAGGINPELKIGDVTVASQWGWADGPLGTDDDGFWMPVDPGMLAVASKVSREVKLGRCTPDSVCLDRTPIVVVGGNGVSNSFFVDDRLYREWLWDTFRASAVDMETYAVARIAHERGVPFVAFRSLSDLAGGGPGVNQIEIFFQLAADNAAAVVMAFLEAWAENRAE